MSHDYTLADRQGDERDSLDAMGQAAYRRCRAGGMPHWQALQVGRDDVAIRERVARRRVQAPPLACDDLGGARS